MAFFGFTRHPRQERAGFALYCAAVAAARDPYLYEVLRVPDTLDGRFDMVGLQAFLVIRRLQAAGGRQAALVAQALFDAMFSDMDINLREIGVGDMVIGKRVRAMWEAFHGRCAAYQAAMEHGQGALAEALARNVWRGDGPAGEASTLAEMVLIQDAALAGQDEAALERGVVVLGWSHPA